MSQVKNRHTRGKDGKNIYVILLIIIKGQGGEENPDTVNCIYPYFTAYCFIHHLLYKL